MKEFYNKTIFFIGDSNIAQPYFLEYLRADLINTGKKTYLYNKGIPGARMDMVLNSVNEEISVVKPDYAALSFGGNDLGIWLYDAYSTVTEKILSEREQRIENYCRALENIIVYLRDKNIEPILMTPLCYNENITEKEDIKTDRDNKEKSAIKDTVFTKATFKNVNENGQRVLSEKGKIIAEKYGVTVWDMYSATKKRADNTCFLPDGIHYNEKGHKIIAEAVYENMFGEKMQYYPIDERVKDVTALEQDERAYFFVKYNLVFLSYGKKEGAELINIFNAFIKEKGYTEGLTEKRAAGFLRFIKDPTNNAKRIKEALDSLFDGFLKQ